MLNIALLNVPCPALQFAAPAIGTAVLAFYRALQFVVFLFVICYGVSSSQASR
jgi:hypothetical protein